MTIFAEHPSGPADPVLAARLDAFSVRHGRRPRLLLVSGPEIFAGPMSYEACEAKRVEFETSARMLCINERMKPGPYGPYTSTPPAKPQAEPL